MQASKANELATNVNSKKDNELLNSLLNDIRKAAGEGKFNISTRDMRGNVKLELEKLGYHIETDPDPRDYGYYVYWNTTEKSDELR